jgi:hypothetical protein
MAKSAQFNPAKDSYQRVYQGKPTLLHVSHTSAPSTVSFAVTVSPSFSKPTTCRHINIICTAPKLTIRQGAKAHVAFLDDFDAGRRHFFHQGGAHSFIKVAQEL